MENNYIINGMHMWHANIIIKKKKKNSQALLTVSSQPSSSLETPIST